MATHGNISSDFKDYLRSNDRDKSSIKDSISGFINKHKTSGWFYQPLSTSEDGECQNVEVVEDRSGWWGSWSQKSEESSWLPSLSRSQRIIGFVMCLGMGITCFVLASLYIPVLILKARKFSLLFTLGSLFVVSSFAILWGPVSHLKHVLSKERLPFTLAYFGSLFATLYFALEVQNTILTVFFAIIQVVALFWYVASYLPGGQTGLFFFGKMVTKSLPV